jgi:hypothetical protein
MKSIKDKNKSVRRAKRLGEKRLKRRKLLDARKKQHGSKQSSVVRQRTILRKLTQKKNASRAATPASPVTARAKGSPTSRSKGGFLSKIWNRKTAQ